MSARSRWLRELVLQRLKAIVDPDGVMQLQADLVCSALRAYDAEDQAMRRARLALERAWRDYGHELGVVLEEVGEAASPPPR